MAVRFTCAFCKGPLPKRDARCRVCGWARDYDPRISRREREVALGVGLMVVGIFLAIAVAVAIAFVEPLP